MLKCDSNKIGEHMQTQTEYAHRSLSVNNNYLVLFAGSREQSKIHHRKYSLRTSAKRILIFLFQITI